MRCDCRYVRTQVGTVISQCSGHRNLDVGHSTYPKCVSLSMKVADVTFDITQYINRDLFLL